MKVNSNMQAMIASNILKNNESRFSASTEKMSSGYRINSAKDSPSGMAITNRMNAQLKSLEKSNQNAHNAVSVIQTAEGSLSEIQNMVQRMNELAIKSANGSNTSEDRKAIQTEVEQLCREIERIAKDTDYNTQNLLAGDQSLKGYTSNAAVDVASYNDKLPADKTGTKYALKLTSDGENITVDAANCKGFDPNGKFTVEEGTVTYKTPDGAELIVECDAQALGAGTFDVDLDLRGIGGMKIQVGTQEGQEIKIIIPEISLRNMNIDDIDVSTQESAKKAIDKCVDALSYISSARSKLGAYQNRFEATISSLDEIEENLTNSYSTIKDIDMAEEMVNYTTLQVLTQAGTTMLTQANEMPQMALQLLQ